MPLPDTIEMAAIAATDESATHFGATLTPVYVPFLPPYRLKLLIKYGQDGTFSDYVTLDANDLLVETNGTVGGSGDITFSSGIVVVAPTGGFVGWLITNMKKTIVYYYTAVMSDEQSNAITSNIVSVKWSASTADITDPSISAVTAGSITQTSANIAWTTNENSTSVVEYDPVSSPQTYGNTASDAALVMSHAVALTGLTAGVEYAFRVRSMDAQGNEAVTIGTPFRTLAETSTEDGALLLFRGFVSENATSITAVAVDSSDNIIIGGHFVGTVNIEGGTPESSPGTAGDDGLIVKYNTDGVHQWQKHISGTAISKEIKSIATDSTGNIYVAGKFITGTVVIDASTETALGSSASLFVAKFLPGGTLSWLKGYSAVGGSTIIEQGHSLALDSSGNVIVTGQLTGTINYGGTSLASIGGSDVMLLKLASASGATLWARRYGGSNIDNPRAVCVDKDGDVIIAGYFFNSTDMGGGTMTAAAGVNDTDIFVAKYNGSTGAFIWQKRFGGSGGDYVLGIASDPVTGNIFIGGKMGSDVDFGSGNIVTSGSAGGGVFIVGLNPSGGFLWGKATGGGLPSSTCRTLFVDVRGNFFACGLTAEGIYFGGATTLLGNGQPCPFLAAFLLNLVLPNAEPAYQWGKVFGGGNSGAGQVNMAKADSADNMIVVGSWIAGMNFGDGVVHTSTPGYRAGFLAKYSN